MTETKFVVGWTAGFENNTLDYSNEIERLRQRYEAWRYFKNPSEETMRYNAGIGRLYTLAGQFHEDPGSQRYRADNGHNDL